MTVDVSKLRMNIPVKVDQLLVNGPPFEGDVLTRVGQIGMIHRVRAGEIGNYFGALIEVTFLDGKDYVFMPDELSLVDQI
jgi:hypothetical protein